MKRLQEHRIVFHGLRKNAVNMLLEVGCTEDEVGAIVGMPAAMVRHYAKEVRRHHLAINAMRMLETGWAEIRKNVLGSAADPRSEFRLPNPSFRATSSRHPALKLATTSLILLKKMP